MAGPGFPTNTRFGLHYFPDSLHYREKDLALWLPNLVEINAGWLVLEAHPFRAIPEDFIRGVQQAGIAPIPHIRADLSADLPTADLAILFRAYAGWGVKQIILHDRPNCAASWSGSAWVEQDLVDRFLDRWLPLANTALQCGLRPVFPPLEPGGDFWDTIFLRSALRGLRNRKQTALLESLVLSAYAWTHGHPLDWGAGGPMVWPDSRPYYLPEGSQDQRGFRIFDWYQTIAQAELQNELPVILLQAGRKNASCEFHAEQNKGIEKETIQAIADLISAPPKDKSEGEQAGLNDKILAVCFWLLSAEEDSPYFPEAWFTPDGKARKEISSLSLQKKERASKSKAASLNNGKTIQHYLLLPSYDWGVAEWHLEVIKPFIKKYQPTVGFSLQEALQAARVTVVANNGAFSEEALSYLRANGCLVEEISGDGTAIATTLAER